MHRSFGIAALFLGAIFLTVITAASPTHGQTWFPPKECVGVLKLDQRPFANGYVVCRDPAPLLEFVFDTRFRAGNQDVCKIEIEEWASVGGRARCTLPDGFTLRINWVTTEPLQFPLKATGTAVGGNESGKHGFRLTIGTRPYAP
ncbi:MAG TPA: hypothetical protein VHL08_09580 [Dongiaceae bacterium]|jgi:hypothetical protein|nr:hypothetical protein [Dongiaceae bacterium]